MAPRFLVATDTWLHAIGGNLYGFDARLGQLDVGDVGMSVITFGELRQRAHGSIRPCDSLVVLDQLALLIPVLPVPVEAARKFCALRLMPTDTPDPWVAAHAFALNATLVTTNPAAYATVEGLKVENWLAP